MMGAMMGGPGMQEGDDQDDEDRAGRGRGWSHGGPRGAPMQVIINIRPDNRVEIEERGRCGAAIGPMGGPTRGGEWRGRSIAGRVEARLDDLHDELYLTTEQQPSRDRFAGAVRDAVGRARPGLQAMAQSQTLDQALEAHEAMLTARLDALRAIRTALSGLQGL